MTKYMSIKEFQEKGYLQELNRRFLHPLGLALEIGFDNEKTYIIGIWDYREDPEGIYYDLNESSNQRIRSFQKNFEFIEQEFEKRRTVRENLFNNIIEPIPS